MNNSHKTAIYRNAPSVPMRILHDRGLLVGRMLDYGCGRGFDANFFGMESYDPYYAPDMPEGEFDTITCNYVFNVLEEKHEQALLSNIKDKLKKNGVAYISVYRDIRKYGFTSKGTFQRDVILDLPVLIETRFFCIYVLKK